MSIVAGDWTIDRSTKVIAYTGDDHGGASPSYATVIEFHRWLQGLADDAVASGDDELDITNVDPSRRSTDNIITLINGYTIGDAEMEHLYDGSIIQADGDTIYDGVVNFGNASVQIQLLQDGAVLSDDWWNYGGGGLNADATAGISHRFMIKTRANGVDIDGRRLVGTCRSFGNTYSEFKINGTSRGNNVLALTDSDDLNNETVEGTVSGWTTITNTEGLRLIDVDNDGADEEYYSEWNKDTYSINQFYERMKWLVRDGSASNLYGLNGEVFRGITHSFAFDGETGGIALSTNDKVAWGTAIAYDNEASGPFTIGEAIHEDTATPAWKGRILAIDDNGTAGTLIVDVESGTVTDNDSFTGQSSSATADVNGTPTAVTGGGLLHCLAVDDDGATGNLYVQLLKGTAPADNAVLYDCATDPAAADATKYLSVNGSVTERTISTPFCGQSTGSAIIGAYGFGIESNDLSASDKVTDLTGTVQTPPNNVTNTVAGLVSGADRVLVAPWDGSSTDTNGDPAITKDQFSLATALTTDNITSVVVSEAIPSDTPSAGYIRVTDNDGFERRLHYSSVDSGTKTFTIDTTDGNEDFASVNASAGNDIYLAYIDELAAATTAAYTSVQSGSRDLVVIVRDGASTPIKQFISSWSQTSSNQTITAIRTTDA